MEIQASGDENPNRSMEQKSFDQENLNSPSAKVSRNPLRNLAGKRVFLDLNNSGKLLGRVRECLSLIDVRFADCLSKDVDFVITNREKCSTENSTATPVKNNDELPKKSKTSPSALTFFSRSNSLINRTQAILEKASKGTNSMTDIIATAKRLGINVMNISELEKYIDKYIQKKRNLDQNNKMDISMDEKQPNQCIEKESPKNFSSQIPSTLSQTFTNKSLEKFNTSKAFKLKSPFLKIESVCKQYKPIYQEFKEWHEIDLKKSHGTQSPFQAYFSDNNKSSSDISLTRSRSNEIENQSDRSDDECRRTRPPMDEFKSPDSSNVISIKKPLSGNKKSEDSRNLEDGGGRAAKLSLRKSSSTSKNININAGKNTALMNIEINSKKRTTGYCESCKHRYENLKQHLTSLQHENFGNNPLNFKEIDQYADGILSFRTFLLNKGLLIEEDTKSGENNYSEVDNKKPEMVVSLSEIKEFAREFTKKRQSLGISKNQIVQELKNLNEPFFNESTIERFERLDITPKSGSRIKPVLERLLSSKELKLTDEATRNYAEDEIGKKRKRVLSQAFREALAKKTIPTEEELRSSQATLIKKFKKSYLSKNVTLNLIENHQLNSSLNGENSDGEEVEDKVMTKVNITRATPVRSSTVTDLRQQGSKTPNASPLSLSSPSAAVLFSLNNNSFSMATRSQDKQRRSSTSSNAATARIRLKASRIELSSELNSNMSMGGGVANTSMHTSVTEPSGIDDIVVSAFMNDFSYEIARK